MWYSWIWLEARSIPAQNQKVKFSPLAKDPFTENMNDTFNLNFKPAQKYFSGQVKMKWRIFYWHHFVLFPRTVWRQSNFDKVVVKMWIHKICLIPTLFLHIFLKPALSQSSLAQPVRDQVYSVTMNRLSQYLDIFRTPLFHAGVCFAMQVDGKFRTKLLTSCIWSCIQPPTAISQVKTVQLFSNPIFVPWQMLLH